MNKKGINLNLVFWAILSILVLYIVIYLLSFIFPYANNLNAQINYLFLVSVFIALQIVVVLIISKILTYGFKKIHDIKMKIEKWSYSLQRYLS